jgi:hypothetical protein
VTLNTVLALSIIAIVISWIPVICSTAVACRCRCAVCGCGPCCSCGPEAQVGHAIAWGWYLIVSATSVWIIQLIFVSIAYSECSLCQMRTTPAPPPPSSRPPPPSSYYNSYYYNSYGGSSSSSSSYGGSQCPYGYLPYHGLGTAASFAAALGVLLSIPAVLRSEAAILEKQRHDVYRGPQV